MGPSSPHQGHPLQEYKTLCSPRQTGIKGQPDDKQGQLPPSLETSKGPLLCHVDLNSLYLRGPAVLSFRGENTSFKDLLSKTQLAFVCPWSLASTSPIAMPVPCLPSSRTSSVPNKSHHPPNHPRMRALHGHSCCVSRDLRDPQGPGLRRREPHSLTPPRPASRPDLAHAHPKHEERSP